MKVLSKLLKPGEATSEYKNTNKVVWIGVFLIFADKLSVLGIGNEQLKDLADMMRNNVNEVIGAVLIFGSSALYRIERVFLKYQQLKHGIVDEAAQAPVDNNQNILPKPTTSKEVIR